MTLKFRYQDINFVLINAFHYYFESERVKLGTMKMSDALKIYRSLQVCHQLFLRINSWTIPLILTTGMAVFVFSAFPLIMFNSETSRFHLLTFVCLCTITIAGTAFYCEFCCGLTRASQECVYILRSITNLNPRDKLMVRALQPLDVPFNRFFTMGRQSLVLICRFDGDLLITWILAYIQSE